SGNSILERDFCGKPHNEGEKVTKIKPLPTSFNLQSLFNRVIETKGKSYEHDSTTALGVLPTQ
ncbi:hypothetical protein ACP52K_003957, partial [Vibrio alginolyticus]